MAQDVDFSKRVRELRDERGLSQGDAARRAGLTPASLSRILSGERPLRLDQAVALARALGVSVLELTQGTNAAGILSEWVPRAEFDMADRERAVVLRELELSRAEGEAHRAEAAALRDSVREMSQSIAELEAVLPRLQADARRVDELAREKASLTRRVHELNAELSAARQEAASLRARAEDAIELANRNFAAWDAARTRLAMLEKDLTKAKSDQVGVGVVVAALAGLAGAMLASPATNSKGRRGA